MKLIAKLSLSFFLVCFDKNTQSRPSCLNHFSISGYSLSRTNVEQTEPVCGSLERACLSRVTLFPCVGRSCGLSASSLQTTAVPSVSGNLDSRIPEGLAITAVFTGSIYGQQSPPAVTAARFGPVSERGAACGVHELPGRVCSGTLRLFYFFIFLEDFLRWKLHRWRVQVRQNLWFRPLFCSVLSRLDAGIVSAILHPFV